MTLAPGLPPCNRYSVEMFISEQKDTCIRHIFLFRIVRLRCGQFFSIAECYNFIETNQTPIKVVDSEANKNSNSNVEAEADYGS